MFCYLYKYKIPQLDENCESEGSKRRRKEERRKIVARLGLMDRFVLINSPTSRKPIKKERAASSSEVMCTDEVKNDASIHIQSSVSECKDNNAENNVFGVAEKSLQLLMTLKLVIRLQLLCSHLTTVTSAIGNWPHTRTASVRDYIMQARPPKLPPNYFVYSKTNNRQFHPSHFCGKFLYGESFIRS